MGSLGWAVTLSVFSAASYAGAAVAQERLAEHRHRGLLRWAAALLLTAGGVGLHVLALNFGTVAVVQALGTLTLLFALPISALRYRLRIGVAGLGRRGADRGRAGADPVAVGRVRRACPASPTPRVATSR